MATMTEPAEIRNGELPRTLPELTQTNRYFWCGGEDGHLHILHCQDCDYYIHPDSPRCPKCLSENVKPDRVSGRGQILSYTINHQPWVKDVPVPFIIALVQLEEAPHVHLLTNISNCEFNDVRIRMPVKVFFEKYEEVYLPLFEPGE